MNVFSKKGDSSPFGGIGFNIGGIIHIDPNFKINGCINLDGIPTGITICHNTGGPNNKCFRKIKLDFKITKLTIEFTFSMENIRMPTFLVVHRHFWIPLCHIILAFVIPGPFHHLTHMMGPVKINPNRLARG